MATITAEGSTPIPGMYKLFWETLTENDTATAEEAGSLQTVVGSVQFTGTFGGATVLLEVSNDGTNYETLKDITGTLISFTAAGLVDFSTAARYIKPSASGGTGQDIDITVILRT